MFSTSSLFPADKAAVAENKPFLSFSFQKPSLWFWCAVRLHGIMFSPSSTKVFFHGTTTPSGPRPSHYRVFTVTLRHTTLGRTPLDEWSARRRIHHLTTHNTHNRLTSMTSVGFEPTIPATERPLDQNTLCGQNVELYIKTQSVPRSKHTPSQLQKPVS
jgi:hypothetical protein